MPLDKFISDDGPVILGECYSCRHKHKRAVTCEAFPGGIPDEILRGERLHREKYPGQENNVVYAPR